MYFSFAIFAKFYLALFAKNKIKINQVLIPGSPPYTPRYFPLKPHIVGLFTQNHLVPILWGGTSLFHHPLSPTLLGFSHKNYSVLIFWDGHLCPIH